MIVVEANTLENVRSEAKHIDAEDTDSSSCDIAITDFIGSVSTDGLEEPQAFMVELKEAGGTLDPHFHPVDQFQIFTRGKGKLGKADVVPVSVQYSDRFSPYGPIVAEEKDTTFFTLRTRHDTGAHVMPGSEDEMEQKAQRNLTCVKEPLRGADLRSREGVTRKSLIDMHEDGMGVWALTAGPGERVTGPDPGRGAGQYYMVIGGSMRVDGRTYPRWSCLYVRPDETALEYESGEDGSDVVLMQFPRKDD